MTRQVTIEEYGMAKGCLWYQKMLDDGWLFPSDGPEVNVEQCRDVVAIVDETDFVFYGEEGEDADEMQIAIQTLMGALSEALGDHDEALKMGL